MPLMSVLSLCEHALASYGHCVLKLQVPPIEATARVTFEVVDVSYPILSVAMLVATGHREIFRGQEDELSTAGGAVAPLMRVRGFWLWCGSTTAERAVRHVMYARRLGLIPEHPFCFALLRFTFPV